MNWKDFFKLNVTRETLLGDHPSFQAELKVSDNFTMDELLMREFSNLNLTDRKKRLFDLNMRKIFVRQHCFKSPEFERIVENFIERISSEKDQLLTFFTSAEGFISLWQSSK